MRPDQIAAWETKYQKLVLFQRQHGHADVPRSWHDRRLNVWVVVQRGLFKKGRLAASRKARLKKLGLGLTPIQTRWEARLGQLEAFIRRHGRLPVREDSAKEDTQLRHWIVEQRESARTGRLRPDRERRLKAVGLVLRPFEEEWQEHFEQLRAFHKANGHFRIPRSGELASLSMWLSGQRSALKRGELPRARQVLLESLGVIGDPRGRDWERGYRKLVQHRRRHGNLDHLPQPLHHWLLEQHRRARAGSIRADERSKLQAIDGLQLRPLPKETLELRFQQLEDFHRRTGHILVPRDWKEHPGLALWIRNQRGRQSQGTLMPSTLKRLRALGFTDRIVDEQWDQQWELAFAQLKAFHRRHGHTAVRRDREPRLFYWCHRQRRHLRQGKLLPERRARLEALEFRFDFPEDEYHGQPWQHWLDRLEAFIRETGRNVPPLGHPLRRVAEQIRKQRSLPQDVRQRLKAIGFSMSPWQEMWNRRIVQLTAFYRKHGYFPAAGFPSLGPWLIEQRYLQRDGKLAPAREKQLRAIGYTFGRGGSTVQDPLLQALQRFKQEHGHLDVPKDSEHSHLASWMELQRRLQRRGSLRPKTQQALSRLGFPWIESEVRWEGQFARLIAFQRRHGSGLVPGDSALGAWVSLQQRRHQKEELSLDEEERLRAVGVI